MEENNFLFRFIEELENDLGKELGAIVRKLDSELFNYPDVAAAAGRQFIERVIQEVWLLEKDLARKFPEYNYQSLADKINSLFQEEYISMSLKRDFDQIRVTGNRASHEPTKIDISEAIVVHKKIYDVAKWFVENYGPHTIDVPTYISPIKRPEKVNVQPNDIVETVLKELNKRQQTMDILSKNPLEEELNSNVSEEKINWRNYFEGLNISGSYLAHELSKLRAQSVEAVDHADKFDYFKHYMHVTRKIEEDLLETVRQRQEHKKNLIFICGNVGDGKSHLVAYLNQYEKDLASQYYVINDATESSEPNKTAMETLEELLSGFSDEKIDETTENDKVILAINMGVLNNFIHTNHERYHFTKLKEFVESSGLFTTKVVVKESSEQFDLLSFGDYHMYHLTANGADSPFYKEILQKICDQTEENPFYVAYKLDQENKNDHSIVHTNYMLLSEENIQNRIIQLLIKIMVIDKNSISVRSFLDFISDLVIPSDIKNEVYWSSSQILENSLPALLFRHSNKSPILQKVSNLHPYHIRNKTIDEIIIRLNTAEEKVEQVLEKIKNQTYKKLFENAFGRDEEQMDTNMLVEFYIMYQYLADEEFAAELEDPDYEDYLSHLYAFNCLNTRNLKMLYHEVEKAIFIWQGTPPKHEKYIYLNQENQDYLLAQKLEIQPAISPNIKPEIHQRLEAFTTQIKIGFKSSIISEEVSINIDFSLYKLIKKVLSGYRPNKADKEQAINFINFITSILEYGEQEKEVLIHFVKEKKFYKMSRGYFDEDISFEREKIGG